MFGPPSQPALPPAEANSIGLSAHCRRVAAWAVEIASILGIEPRYVTPLRQAALLHHYPVLLLNAEAAEHLASDLRLLQLEPASTLDPLVRNILAIFHCLDDAVIEGTTAKLAEILDMSDKFDSHLELDSWAESGMQGDPAAQAVARWLRVVDPGVAMATTRKLPVFPVVAQKLMALLLRPNVTLWELECVASSDQVLAASIIRAANSSYYGHRQEIRTLRHAVSYIGFEATRGLLYGASLRPMFASAHLRQLWNHSLESAQIAEQIAIVSGRVDSNEAFLAALVHDIGQLSMTLLPSSFQERYSRLRERGCPNILVEKALSGASHAETGAALLKMWNFPSSYVEAIRFHHEPERTSSTLAAILYLAEFWTSSDEDIPSWIRLKFGLEKTGLSLRRLYAADIRNSGILTTLAFTA